MSFRVYFGSLKARLQILDHAPPTRICCSISISRLCSANSQFWASVCKRVWNWSNDSFLILFGLAEPVNFIPAVSLWLEVFGEFLLCRFEISFVSIVENLFKNFSNSWSGSVEE